MPAPCCRSSQAAAPLAKWVLAQLKYAQVLEKVAPLTKELGDLGNSFNQSQVTLRAHQCPAQAPGLTTDCQFCEHAGICYALSSMPRGGSCTLPTAVHSNQLQQGCRGCHTARSG